ncbi:MAG: hypothetical protein ACRYHC_12555 [Janthinobacterium lividum]
MLSFLNGGSELGRRIRDYDWLATPMGPPEQWPVALKALLGVMVDGNQPMFIVWGAEQTLLYNDGYVDLLGDKHPVALGRPLLDVWHEIADDLRPLVAQAYAGTPVHDDDILLWMERHGHREETHFAFGYTP